MCNIDIGLASLHHACNSLEHPRRIITSNGTRPELLDQNDLIGFNMPRQNGDGITTLEHLSANTIGPTAIKASVAQRERIHPEVAFEYGLSCLDLYIT
jgi:hypothetical protein